MRRGRVRVRDDDDDTLVSFVVRRFVFVISSSSFSDDDDDGVSVVAFIRDENQFLPFEPCASFPYTECSCELCGTWILPVTRTNEPRWLRRPKTCSGYTDR